MGRSKQLQHWNNGIRGKPRQLGHCFFPVIPSFHHSIIPLFHCATARVVLALLVLGAPGAVRADFWDMASRFQVYVSAQEEYSDNIDLTASNKLDDFITTVSPGLKFSSLPRTRVAAGEFRQTPGEGEENFGMNGDYHPGFVFYAKNTDRNYVSHDGTLNAWYTLDKRLTFRVREYLLRSEDPREPDYSQTAIPGQYILGTQRNRSTYLRNVFEPSLEYKFGKENLLSMSYQNNLYNTQNSSGRNSVENYFNPRLSYWFDIQNGVSLDYGLTLGHFEGSPDLVGHSVKGRYTYRFDPKTSLFGEYTFMLRNFDTPVEKLPVPIFPPPEPPSLDYTVHNPTVGIERVFSPTFSAKGQIGYYWQIPDQGSKKAGPFYNISLTKQAERTNLTLSLQGGYTEDFFSAQNLGFTKSYSAIGAVSHHLAEKMTVGLTGSFQRAISYDPDQKENIWDVSGNTSYQVLRWLSLFLSVSHREDHSSISTQSYAENRGIFRMTATY